MAKDKTVSPIRDGSYGVIKEKLGNGMFMTNKGHKIPPFNGYKIGDEVVMEKGAYKIGDGIDAEVAGDTPVTQDDIKKMNEEIAELKKKNESLEISLGEKGSAVKGDSDAK